MLAKVLVSAAVVAASFAAAPPASARCVETSIECHLSCLPRVNVGGPEPIEFRHYYC